MVKWHHVCQQNGCWHESGGDTITQLLGNPCKILSKHWTFTSLSLSSQQGTQVEEDMEVFLKGIARWTKLTLCQRALRGMNCQKNFGPLWLIKNTHDRQSIKQASFKVCCGKGMEGGTEGFCGRWRDESIIIEGLRHYLSSMLLTIAMLQSRGANLHCKNQWHGKRLSMASIHAYAWSTDKLRVEWGVHTWLGIWLSGKTSGPPGRQSGNILAAGVPGSGSAPKGEIYRCLILSSFAKMKTTRCWA